MKYHEKKLLKKVNFFDWKSTSNKREAEVLRRYHVSNREEYHNYNKIVGKIHKMTTKLKALSRSNGVRIDFTQKVRQFPFMAHFI